MYNNDLLSSQWDAFWKDLPLDAILITINQRLARELQAQYRSYQQRQSQTSWPSLMITTFETWLIDKTLSLGQYELLSPLQSFLLGSETLRSGKTETIHADLDSISQAWAWCLAYEMSDLPSTTPTSLAYRTYLQWKQTYVEALRDLKVLDRAELSGYWIPLLKQHAHLASEKLIFVGFETPTPQHLRLRALLPHTQTRTLPRLSQTQASRLLFPTREQELEHFILWSHHYLSQHPQARVACILPDLSQRRESVLQHFEQLAQVPYHISVGQALSEYSIITAAWQILSLNAEAITYLKLSQLLLSPFIGHFANLSARALWDVSLRDTGIAVFNLALLKTVNSLCPPQLTHFQEQLYQLLAHLEKPPRQKPSDWAGFFNAQLLQIGWPGSRSLNSAEYQTLQQLKQVFTDFASLDRLSLIWTHTEALQYLQHALNKTLFQPSAQPAAIQVLGALEATDLNFDVTWILGLESKTWPLPIKPNPWIPLSLQRQYAMPHSSIEREYDFALRMTNHLQFSASTVMFSSPELEGDEQLISSPLIQDYPLIAVDNFIKPTVTTPHWQYISDDIGPTWQTDEKLRGGSNLLKEQSLCPFKAFAKYRLNADSIPEPALGFDALDRGLLVHRALEYWWKAIKTQENARQLSSQEREEKIRWCCTSAVNEIPTFAVREFLKPLEIEHLQYLLTRWINLELSRPPFKVVAIESALKVQIGALSLSLRIDRIDQLEDGSHILIDYKTGTVSTQEWMGERLRDPQLPLYSLSIDLSLSGIAYAELRPDRLGLKGIGTTPPLETLSNEAFKEQQTQWETAVTLLAEEFVTGYAAPQPIDDSVCEYCDYSLMCRIWEKAL